GERLALQVFHDQEIDAVLVTYVMQGADVGMVQAGDGARLALEALPQFGVAGEVAGEDLDRHGPVESRVSGAIHLAHPARATGREDLEGAQPCARTKRHFERIIGPPSRCGLSYSHPPPVTTLGLAA